MTRSGAAIQWPAGVAGRAGRPNAEWCRALADKLAEASQAEPKRLPRFLPAAVFGQLVTTATLVLAGEDNVVDLHPPDDARVVVVGDTHGQLHDVLHMLALTGGPGPKLWYVFNGDYVDRGAWGVETLAMLLAWKLACPRAVTLLRGNHECEFCVNNYGFLTEMKAKYTASTTAELYPKTLRLFSQLPLAARIGKTLVLHGGLFRQQRKPPKRKRDAAHSAGGGSGPDDGAAGGSEATASVPSASSGGGAALASEALSEGAPLPLDCLGDLNTLRTAFRGGVDPDGMGKTQTACDVLWSDPGPAPGVVENCARGVGLIFGPDATAAFCDANGVRLLIRSHEGPDARDKREGMHDMLSGWSVDHVTPSGARLATLFSAPDYPQFYAPTAQRLNNTAAVAVLTGAPDWCTEDIVRYTAAPRPHAQPFYDLDEPGSDEEGPTGAPHHTEQPTPTPQAAPAEPPQSLPSANDAPNEAALLHHHHEHPTPESVALPSGADAAEPGAAPQAEPSPAPVECLEPAGALPDGGDDNGADALHLEW